MASPNASKNSTLVDDYLASLGAMESIHNEFEEKEKILLSQPIGKISKEELNTRLTDPTLLSAVIKQNNSVMAQMPSGKIVALTKENRGKSLFMDLIFHNHVIPNATSQYDVFTKLWLLSFYRKVYGSMPALVDFVTGGSYGKKGAGPDFTILPIRSVIPQVGKYTETDCDYIYVRSRVSKTWLENRKGDDNWKNIDKILEAKGDFTMEYNASSYVERKTEGGMVKRDEYELVTRYENDKWTTFHPATKVVAREFGNPQKNDEKPVVMCHAYPLLDRFIGLGDFERGKTLYAAAGNLISLYMEGMKVGIRPNIKVDPSAIENWAQIKQYGIVPGQVFLMKPQFFDKLEQMSLAPNLNSFQSTYQFLKAAIMTVTNTSDTSISQDTDVGFGKTPQALKMQAFSQGMQTQFDRRMLEISTEKIFDRMIDLIAKRQEKPMELYLKEADLKAVSEIAPDVVEMFEVGNMGKVTIKPKDIANAEYRYEIDAGSTVKKDEIIENQTLTEILGFIMKMPGAMQAAAQGGLIPLGDKMFNLGEAVKRWVITSGVTDWDKIITDNEQAQAGAMNIENPAVAGAVSQTLGQPSAGQPVNFNDPAIAQVFQELQGLNGGGQSQV